MNSTLKITLITIACFLVAGAFVQNWRTQWENGRRIDELQKQVAKTSGSPANNTAPTESAPPTTGPDARDTHVVLGNDGGVGFVQKQRNIKDIMDVGWKLINKKEPGAAAQAAQVFQEGLDKVDDKSPDLYNGLGRALLIAGKPIEAMAAWQKGLLIAPKFADMQSGIGWACWRMNDPYFAMKAWEAAVAIDPKCVDAWSGLAWVDMALGKKDQAVEGFQVLYTFDRARMDWFNGLTLARAGNRDPEKFAQYFPLPPLEEFNHPPASEPTASAAAPGVPPT